MSLFDYDPTIAHFINRGAINTVKFSVKNLIDIFKDNWDEIIRFEMHEQFTPTTYAQLRPLITKELNVLKQVINETALVYKNPAQRTAILDGVDVDENGNEVQRIDEVYEEVIDDTSINPCMKSVNKFTELTNQTMVKVAWRDNSIKYDILTFDNVEVFTDPEDWSKIIAIKYYVNLELPMEDLGGRIEGIELSSGIKLEKFTFSYLWTIEEERDKSGNKTGKVSSFFRKFKQNESNGREVEVLKVENPYRDENGEYILPFVLFNRQYPTMNLLDFTSGSDLLDASLNTAINMIHLNELIKYQSYKQVVLNVPDKDKLPRKIDMDARSTLVLEDESGTSSASVLDLQADIDKLWGIIKERIIMISNARGIPPGNIMMGSTPASGFSIKLDNHRLLEKREDDIELYRIKEKELFEVTRIINNYHNPKKIDVKAKFKIDFGEIDFPASEEEVARKNSIELTQNVITPVDIIMDKNPDLTKEEAEKIFFENKAMNQSNNSGVVVQQTEQPEQEESEEEQEIENG